MRATFNSLLAAKRRERAEETGDAGFSLIELIIVVVIIGILVAIALPLFAFIQQTAVDGATQATTKNAATTAVAQLASGAAAPDLAKFNPPTAGVSTTLTVSVASGSTPSDICIQGSDTAGLKYKGGAGGTVFKSGPGC
ncbi:hypothetical protein LK09_03955 [Microbacterium mangrovi]|uniref:Prepilin-type N-terminal cleavage/methylation domain-containing protein n=2 Tax=Microbacterium mangrovi TaxID=1348253 RepID=A0A0B2A6K8_9MICO|nr:hypothetical protein LK09_03955 [Microbacterium mangrovi]